MTVFISLALSDTMFPDACSASKRSLEPEEIRFMLEGSGNYSVVSALNPSHATTIDAIRRRFDLELPIPERAPKVQLEAGDFLVVVQAQLPRLAEGQVHSQETIDTAVFKFSLWTVDEYPEE